MTVDISHPYREPLQAVRVVYGGRVLAEIRNDALLGPEILRERLERAEQLEALPRTFREFLTALVRSPLLSIGVKPRTHSYAFWRGLKNGLRPNPAPASTPDERARIPGWSPSYEEGYVWGLAFKKLLDESETIAPDEPSPEASVERSLLTPDPRVTP